MKKILIQVKDISFTPVATVKVKKVEHSLKWLYCKNDYIYDIMEVPYDQEQDDYE